MNELGNLNERVESAVEKFKQSEELRRSENRSLSRILNDLEIKFEARTAELDHCQKRIAQLEESNSALTGLVGQLVEIVEKTADDVAGDPVYRASAAASAILERYDGDNVSPPGAGNRNVPAEDVLAPTVSPPDHLAEGRFEDIDDDFRMAEGLFEKTEGASEFPKLVYDAIAAGKGDTVENAPVELPDPDAVVEKNSAPEGDLDIKEIMARLEIAAERAQLRADEDARRDQIEPEVLDRAVGGRA